MSLSLLSAFTLNAQDCSELFISEYVEGSGQSKALEIYNPTNQSIDLSDYIIKRYKNGNNVPDTELALSGVLEPYDVVVISNGQTEDMDTGFGFVAQELYDLADIHGTGDYATSPMFFNGNDALTIEKIDQTIVDIFGVVGEDPGDGSGWNDDATVDYVAGPNYWDAWTKDHTMIRKGDVKKGVTTNPSFFNTALEYDSIPKDTYTNLGIHSCDCSTVGLDERSSTQVYIFPNPSKNGHFQINSSSGLSFVEIYNIIGQPVYRDENVRLKKTISVNTTSFKSGIYFVKILFIDSKEQIHKIVIQ